MNTQYLPAVIKQFNYYKTIGEKAMRQISDDMLFWKSNDESNSIAIIVQHLSGNMLSRWTDFLTSDGEKTWRNRDAEFETIIHTKEELWIAWNKGWECFLNVLNTLKEEDLSKIIYIRNEGHTVLEAINRQLAHYPYHIGQIIYIAKMNADKFESLSIPKNQSQSFNQEKFSKEKAKGHFTDDVLKGNKS